MWVRLAQPDQIKVFQALRGHKATLEVLDRKAMWVCLEVLEILALRALLERKAMWV